MKIPKIIQKSGKSAKNQIKNPLNIAMEHMTKSSTPASGMVSTLSLLRTLEDTVLGLTESSRRSSGDRGCPRSMVHGAIAGSQRELEAW